MKQYATAETGRIEILDKNLCMDNMNCITRILEYHIGCAENILKNYWSLFAYLFRSYFEVPN